MSASLQLPEFSPCKPEESRYNRALVVHAICLNNQLHMVVMDFQFTNMNTIKEQEAIIRDHLEKPAFENGDREIDREKLVSVNRMHTETDDRKFSETFEPLARQMEKVLQESNHSENSCTAFIVCNPKNVFSDKTVLNPNSSYRSVLSAVNRAGNAAWETHRQQKELAR
jgi:hypothetical protein